MTRSSAASRASSESVSSSVTSVSVESPGQQHPALSQRAPGDIESPRSGRLGEEHLAPEGHVELGGTIKLEYITTDDLQAFRDPERVSSPPGFDAELLGELDRGGGQVGEDLQKAAHMAGDAGPKLEVARTRSLKRSRTSGLASNDRCTACTAPSDIGSGDTPLAYARRSPAVAQKSSRPLPITGGGTLCPLCARARVALRQLGDRCAGRPYLSALRTWMARTSVLQTRKVRMYVAPVSVAKSVCTDPIAAA